MFLLLKMRVNVAYVLCVFASFHDKPIYQRDVSKWAELGSQNVFSTMGFKQLLGLLIFFKKTLLFKQFYFSFPIQLLVNFMNDII